MSWQEIIKKWVGFCPACKSWRSDSLSKKSGNKFYCIKPINYRGRGGEAQMYLRENLERFDKLDWFKNAAKSACGMELLDGEDVMGSLKTYKDFTDFRDL
jgi:hypothetical protein|tara:strand:+ start:105 stop:404 length:300 start_codon:yes stop_codon:yes gene_type:complete